ncbi:MAG: hypothetical protein K8T91_06395 [Planctomycetes bacterium]|nr:hypothetical protein [Planctomycetota bacterium]
MSQPKLPLQWMFSIALSLVLGTTIASAEPPADMTTHRAPKPKEFGSVYSYGYGSNLMPKDDAKFEATLKKMNEAGFNIIHTTYSEPRLEMCKKHNVQMMVDLLSPDDHHVYKSIDKAKAVCEKLRDNPAVWGYNIWNDPFGKKMYTGRSRDINAVRSWDPTHPAYCGAGNGTYGLNHLNNADMLGYYDFHWSRGIHKQLANSQTLLGLAKNFNALYYTWYAAVPGGDGEQNLRRSMWSTNTGMACGLRGILWFLAASPGQANLINMDTLEWTPAGKDMIKVHQEIINPLKTEIMAVPLPTAVYGSNVHKTLDNQPLPEGMATTPAPGLTPVPADFWLQPTSGDVVLGVSTDTEGRGPVFVANYNAYAPQQVALKLGKPLKASLFNRKDKKWQPLEVKDGSINFPLEAGGGELIRFES